MRTLLILSICLLAGCNAIRNDVIRHIEKHTEKALEKKIDHALDEALPRGLDLYLGAKTRSFIVIVVGMFGTWIAGHLGLKRWDIKLKNGKGKANGKERSSHQSSDS